MFKLPRAVWLLGWVSLATDAASEAVYPLLPFFITTVLGAGAVSLGIVEGAAEAANSLLKILSGRLADRTREKRRLVLFGYGVSSAARPFMALATGWLHVFTIRVLDRVGKGIRGAPRDALVADIAPPELRGAAFGLRQSLDTVGAFLGPLLAMGLMLLWANDFRTVFWVATVPAFLAVALLFFGVQEPERRSDGKSVNPIRRENLRRLSPAYWWVVGIGAVFTLARFSEAFLVLRAQQGGLPLALTPLVLIGMFAIYAVSAYPLGKLSDSMSHSKLLAWGLAFLIGADAALASGNQGGWVWGGIAL
jgi:MFS family permease